MLDSGWRPFPEQCFGFKCYERKLKSELLSIPPRSPDINPIENLFGIAKRMLDQDAIHNKITVESIEAFENRIRRNISLHNKQYNKKCE